jgi:hypothetical protein
MRLSASVEDRVCDDMHCVVPGLPRREGGQQGNKRKLEQLAVEGVGSREMLGEAVSQYP